MHTVTDAASNSFRYPCQRYAVFFHAGPDAQQSTTNNGTGIMPTWVLQLVRLSEPAAAFALLLFPWPWPYV